MSDMYVTSQVRVWMKQGSGSTRAETRAKKAPRRPSGRFIVFDTETTTDVSQRLVFGGFTYGVFEDFVCHPCGEGLIYADELPDEDPEAFAELQAYAKSHSARVDYDNDSNLAVNTRLVLVSRTDFVRRYLYKLSNGPQLDANTEAASIVGFNLPFDISRLAVDVVPARGNRFHNGFSFVMMGSKGYDNIRVTSMGAKGNLFEFAGGYDRRTKQDAAKAPDGRFIDLSTLGFALTGSPMTLDHAGKRFGIAHPKDMSEQEYGVVSDSHITYCRDDVRATMELYEKMMAELYANDIEVPENETYSPASIAKGHLDAIGIVPPMERSRVKTSALGYTMSAFYGGRSEAMIRRTPVPAVLVDFTSMYPTVNALMGNWGLLTAQRIVSRQETGTVQRLLDSVTLDDMFHPETWRNIVGVALVRPDGDILPVRSDYGAGNVTIGINHVRSDEPRWYAIPDLIASKLLTGKTPKVIEAHRFHAAGGSLPLRNTEIRGIPFDPADDLFVYWVEKRAELKAAHKRECSTFAHDGTCEHEVSNQIESFKVNANAGSYGIFVEMNPETHPDGKQRTLYGMGEPWNLSTEHPEKAGAFCFPPIGVVITAAARLMLALLERSVTDAGGTWAFCDTDSMCIVASRTGAPATDPAGRTIPVLTYDDVERIRRRFDSLNPYDRRKVPELLKREAPDSYDDPPLLAYCISAKRYALVTVTGEIARLADESETEDGELSIVKNTEHGLGMYLNPMNPNAVDERGGRNWAREVWSLLFKRDTEAGKAASGVNALEWYDRPAMRRRSVSTWNVYQSMRKWNDGKPYRLQVKPYSFHLLAHRIDKGSTLCAPYERDPSKWLDMPWRELDNPGGADVWITAAESRILQPHTSVMDVSDAVVENFLTNGLQSSGTDLASPEAERRRQAFREYKSSRREVLCQSYAAVVNDYVRHPETKYDGPDGEPCNAFTKGQLQRRHVILSSIEYIGKESNNLDEREVGVLHNGELPDVAASYGSTTDYFVKYVLPVFEFWDLSGREIASRTGVHPNTVSDVLRQRHPGTKDVRQRLAGLAVELVMKPILLGVRERKAQKMLCAAKRKWIPTLAEWAETNKEAI